MVIYLISTQSIMIIAALVYVWISTDTIPLLAWQMRDPSHFCSQGPAFRINRSINSCQYHHIRYLLFGNYKPRSILTRTGSFFQSLDVNLKPGFIGTVNKGLTQTGRCIDSSIQSSVLLQ